MSNGGKGDKRGPYDTKTLQRADAKALVKWLVSKRAFGKQNPDFGSSLIACGIQQQDVINRAKKKGSK